MIEVSFNFGARSARSTRHNHYLKNEYRNFKESRLQKIQNAVWDWAMHLSTKEIGRDSFNNLSRLKLHTHCE
ncbi:hypothetical protein GOZ83_13170 [Agrobacterium vitis]|uniref:hypothetical protein n=1 Tax=Rhizobium/Agrobacterium group TaxID=227290 RepID=UPI0012E7F0BD|nr:MULTISPECIES: hypothetical protein [Rhizobium/Agrobacterium group]MCF1494508.1 hypothetical protein [Allorhizobium ampelinum]MVA46014.1 hypothetical protein [Agrobacterium vitis]